MWLNWDNGDWMVLVCLDFGVVMLGWDLNYMVCDEMYVVIEGMVMYVCIIIQCIESGGLQMVWIVNVGGIL